jgi:hydroxyacylglutathione hydrolase
MIIKAFCFNPFYENTYIIYEDLGEAWIFDPGCSNNQEEKELVSFIELNDLKLTKLLLTHAHIDHILGIDFIYKKFGLKAQMHELENDIFNAAFQVSLIYGVPYHAPDEIGDYIVDNQILIFNNNKIDCIWTPGHSPGSVCFHFNDSHIVIGGDVLFEGSIGRTDLPGGNHNALIKSIKTRLYPLGNEVTIYPGHGGVTTIGQEKLTNPFLNG